jgi:hypothetical protein
LEVDKLDKKLLDITAEFQDNIRAYFGKIHNKNSCDGFDLEELTIQIFYTFSEFRKSIVQYLKENSK